MELQEQLQKFLNQLTSKTYYGLDKEFSYADIINFDDVYEKVTSSKFRKSKLTDETVADIKKKIEFSLINEKPIKFSVPFGAYKAWKLNLDFQPDWAEVFNISYYFNYACSILEVYPYGIEITYTYSDDLMYFVSDIPRDKARNYTFVFQKLLNVFNELCNKIQFKLIEINSLYDSPEEYYIDFLKGFLDNLVFWETKYDEATRNRHLNSSYHNLYLSGERNIGSMSDEIREKYYYYSALMTDAVDCLKERRKFNKNQEKIQLVSVKGPSKCINMGANSTSAVHFWTGQGVLKFNKGKIRDFIYTQSSMEKYKNENKLIKVFVDTVFKSISKNFYYINFIKEE